MEISHFEGSAAFVLSGHLAGVWIVFRVVSNPTINGLSPARFRNCPADRQSHICNRGERTGPALARRKVVKAHMLLSWTPQTLTREPVHTESWQALGQLLAR